jgi:hypothetical protein
MSLEGEKRPIDATQEIAGVTCEASELAEHIRDTDPRWKREELLTQLIEMIDDSHELAVRTQMELEE